MNRVSRFASGTNNVVDPATETILIDNIPSPDGNHNAGDLALRQGRLPVRQRRRRRLRLPATAVRRPQRRLARSERAARQDPAHHAQTAASRPTTRSREPAAARCNITGRTTAGTKCQETFAWGLRNPFRLRLRSERRRHALLHQRRGAGHLGGDRPRPGRRGLRLERPRGPLRRGSRPTAAPARRDDEPDLRLRPRHRLHRRHRRRLRALGVWPRPTMAATCSATTAAARS